jgi:predicted RNase H-like nuclease
LNSKDDILDALVAAVAAKRPVDELARLPKANDPPQDACGLPMQMVYPSDAN